MFLLKALHDAKKLEVPNCPTHHVRVISEVAEVIMGVERAGIRINWLDRIIGEILREKEHHELIQMPSY